MDREAWPTTVHGEARDGHNLAINPPSYQEKKIIQKDAFAF